MLLAAAKRLSQKAALAGEKSTSESGDEALFGGLSPTLVSFASALDLLSSAKRLP